MQEQATAVTDPVTTGSSRRVLRWFHINVALGTIFLTVAAFGGSIIDSTMRNAPLTPLVTAHAIVSSAWLLLFLTQATLVATGRTALHRRMGIAGAVLAVVLIVLGSLTSIELARRGYDLSGDLHIEDQADALGSMVFQLNGLLTFGLLVGTALFHRRRIEIHKRLMLFAVLSLMVAPVAHLIGHWPALRVIDWPFFIVMMSASAMRDRVANGRIHPVSLSVAILLVAWNVVLEQVVLPSGAWHDFATWLIR